MSTLERDWDIDPEPDPEPLPRRRRNTRDPSVDDWQKACDQYERYITREQLA